MNRSFTFVQRHEAGLELMRRGSGIPDSLCALADNIESAVPEQSDSFLASLGDVLLFRRADRGEIEQQREALRLANLECDSFRYTLATVAAQRDTWSAEARSATESEHAANARAAEMESRYRAESLKCNELRGMRATLESNIAAYRAQRDAEAEGRLKAEGLAEDRKHELASVRAVALEEREAAEALANRLSERMEAAESALEDKQRERDAAQARANNAESALRRNEASNAAQLGRYNALHARHESLVAALATVAAAVPGTGL